MRPDFVYAISQEGNILAKYDSVRKCAKALNTDPKVICRLIKNYTKFHNRFYLSYEVNERLGKKSTIKAEITTEDFNSVSKYRDNLILTFSLHNNKTLSSKNYKRMKKEIVDLTIFLNKC
jgi:glycine betaine/choline ABC-type transport system substrate-binding protein